MNKRTHEAHAEEVPFGYGQDVEPSHVKRPLQVLIVDDDVDSVVLMESVFSILGCQTNCVLSWQEAPSKICTMKPDLIIMDWLLDPSIDARDVVRYCTRTFEKHTMGRRPKSGPRTKIVTFSSLTENEISTLGNSFFEHASHWQKPMKLHSLLKCASNLITNLQRSSS